MTSKIKEKETMSLVNPDKHISKRPRTRQQRNVKLVDYVMTNAEYLTSIEEMIIDETKECVTYRLEQQNQNLKKKYSDHIVILLKLDFHADVI